MSKASKTITKGTTMTTNRREESYQLRISAAAVARDREHPLHLGNGDEQRLSTANYAMSFTKGLRHDDSTGLITDKEDFERFRRAIDEGFIDAFTARVRSSPDKERAWEEKISTNIVGLPRYISVLNAF